LRFLEAEWGIQAERNVPGHAAGQTGARKRSKGPRSRGQIRLLNNNKELKINIVKRKQPESGGKNLDLYKAGTLRRISQQSRPLDNIVPGEKEMGEKLVDYHDH